MTLNWKHYKHSLVAPFNLGANLTLLKHHEPLFHHKSANYDTKLMKTKMLCENVLTLNLIYKFTTSVCDRVRCSGRPGPGANWRAEFPVPSLWAKLLEEIRLGHSSAEQRPGIAEVKNGVTGPTGARREKGCAKTSAHWNAHGAPNHVFRNVLLPRFDSSSYICEHYPSCNLYLFICVSDKFLCLRERNLSCQLFVVVGFVFFHCHHW